MANKKDLHRCPRCKRAVDYTMEISCAHPRGKVVALHQRGTSIAGFVSVKNLTAPSTERRARRELALECGEPKLEVSDQ